VQRGFLRYSKSCVRGLVCALLSSGDVLGMKIALRGITYLGKNEKKKR